MHLSELNTGESGIIIKVLGHGGFRRRILEMGFVRGQKVTSLLNAPLKDPIKYKIMEYEVSLRRSEAAMIEIVPYTKENILANEHRPSGQIVSNSIEDIASNKYKEINVALVGNPNSGKTSLFNALSGSHEHVGNYSGVTVDAKLGHFKYNGYKINITDLPGTYALTAYSPEELYVRRYLLENTPDIILNSVVASNLERNLYLTSELIDINQKSVIALNMYDELESSGAKLDYMSLAKLVGIPMVPVVARDKKGLDKLLDTIIAVYEHTSAGKNMRTAKPADENGGEPDVSEIIRHIHIKYSPVIEKEIATISKEIKANDEIFPKAFPHRYWSVKLLEGDREVESILRKSPEYTKWINMREAAVERVKRQLGEDIETAISDEKYGFISGALRETFTPGNNEQKKTTTIIDAIVTHKLFSFPIFLLLLWVMFNATFTLGAYPQEWIESGVGLFGEFISGLLPDGALKDLIVNGIIAGVGSVIVFLPNILILYLFISLMEDSGYMARAAFIMDKLMHKMGLHGKSFIPMIMGFGCNVPAIMSTRTIESKSSRFITILINPFISCSARLPVYILLAGIFFPQNSGTVLMMLYLLGIAVAIITAKMLRKFLFKEDETPFVMELPPYRIPTVNATLIHLWEKCAQYLKKIGSVILFASIIIWFLGYYPRPQGQDTSTAHTATENSAVNNHKGSYLEQIGKFCEPALEPLGLNWKAGVALVSGAAAKEIIVSTLGVLYSDEHATSTEMNKAEFADKASDKIPDIAGGRIPANVTDGIEEKVLEKINNISEEDVLIKYQILKSGDFTPASALAFMVFALLYFPCIATLATISNETGSWKWAFFSFIYSCSAAWILSFVIYNIAALF